ncbi:MAG: hypothetical protein GY833_21635 [Aestuariibacter sp.]|nr:hypothetical protein [Aestuariibacter sp.]|tara:strand:+ start:120366 stop:120527 length:162 start_codon:yes stop_codon:yes gene_type:complete
MVLELLQYVTSGFGVFIGCTFFSVAVILSIGWAINALLIGIRGVKAEMPLNLN